MTAGRLIAPRTRPQSLTGLIVVYAPCGMQPERRAPKPTYLIVVLLLSLIGIWPLVKLGRETPPRVWGLAGLGFGLGVLLTVWLRARLMRRPLSSEPGRLRRWVIACVPPIALIGAAPTGAQLVFRAALEGFVCAIVVLALRAQLAGPRRRIRDDETSGSV